jgi:hypothetical protein
MLVGLGLLGMYYLVLLVRGSRRLLTLMNSSLLAVIVATNLINLFMTSLEEQVSSGTLLMYVVPYLLLLGIVAGISFTFATPQLPNRRSDRGGPEPVSWHRPNAVLVAFTLMLLFSAVFTYLGLSSDYRIYRIAYPLWFSYLFGGIVLWAVILRSQRHLVRRREGRVVHKAPSAATSDLSLPSLPPLDIQGAESLAMPLLPDLEDVGYARHGITKHLRESLKPNAGSNSLTRETGLSSRFLMLVTGLCKTSRVYITLLASWWMI